MKMVKSVYKKILDNVPTHMPETGGMLGGQDGTVTKVVFDDGKDDDFRRCHYTPNVINNVGKIGRAMTIYLSK